MTSKKRIQWLQTGVVALLALAVLCVIMSIQASSNAAHSLGPQALGVVGDQVWIADERGLLVTDAHGEIRLQRTYADIGVKGIANILALDVDRVLIASRDSTDLKLLRASDAQPLRTITLQFPHELENQANHVLWLATRALDSEGHFEIAVATGGNHAVARFNDEGKFLARTTNGLYRYTNGIWFADGGWWTTDTNRFYLRKLAVDTLAQTDEIALAADHTQRFLGAAIASRGAAIKDSNLPLATVVRLQNDMIKGRVVDVSPDGSEVEFPLPPDAEPMDIGWLNKELLVIESARGTILRFDDHRRPLGIFGDVQARQRFDEARHMRQSGKQNYYLWLIAALFCFIAAMLLLQYSRRVTPEEQYSQPALPMESAGVIRRLALMAIWRQFLFFALLMIARIYAVKARVWLTPMLGKAHSSMLVASLVTITFAVFLIWLVHSSRKMLSDPKFEPLFNYNALRWLHNSRQWRDICQPNELPREVINCVATKAGALLLTSQRLIFFRRGISTSTPDITWARAEILSATVDDLKDARGWRRLYRFFTGTRLNIFFRNGEKTSFRVTSVCTARRMADVLTKNPLTSRDATIPMHMIAAPAEIGSLTQQIIASVILPGLGQWMQRRNGKALGLFIYAVVVILFLIIPIAWALITGYTDVPNSAIKFTAVLWLSFCFTSAFEVWLMRTRFREKAKKPIN